MPQYMCIYFFKKLKIIGLNLYTNSIIYFILFYQNHVAHAKKVLLIVISIYLESKINRLIYLNSKKS